MLEFLGYSYSEWPSKFARVVEELGQFFCMTGFWLIVELHQYGSAPATCAVGLFSLYIDKNRFAAYLFLLGAIIIQLEYYDYPK